MQDRKVAYKEDEGDAKRINIAVIKWFVKSLSGKLSPMAQTWALEKKQRCIQAVVKCGCGGFWQLFKQRDKVPNKQVLIKKQKMY